MTSHATPSPHTPDLASALEDLVERLPDDLWADGLVPPTAWHAALLDPARDILSRSGKGFRARLLDRSWMLAGGDPSGPPPLLPVAIELLHVGSLVIDDIEDDSRLRRGAPALHRKFGLPLALNTGNWLYFLAQGALTQVPLDPGLRLALHEDVALALLRCHQGQALDLSVRITATKRAEAQGLIESVTRLKTGALMQLAALMGARASGAPQGVVEAIGRFGIELGVGLQMLDDWSSVAVEARREKGLEDIRLGRPTWPWAWLAASDNELAYAEAVRQTRDLSTDWEANRVLERLRSLLATVARDEIRSRLDSALHALESELGTSAALESVREEVDALQRAYG